MKTIFAFCALFLAFSCHKTSPANRPPLAADPLLPVVKWPENGTTLSYRVVALSGAVNNATEVTIQSDQGETIKWPVDNKGVFKAAVTLQRGENKFIVSAGGASTQHILKFAPPTSGPVIKLTYLVPSDNDGSIQVMAGQDGSEQSAMARYQFAAEISQAAVAELLSRKGLGFLTYRFELDKDDRPLIQKMVSTLNRDEWLAFEGNNNENVYYAAEKQTRDQRNGATEVIIVSACRFLNNVVHSGCAFGDQYDKTGVFGSCGMFSWPQNLTEFRASLENMEPVSGVRSDTGKRPNTFMYNMATTMGATFLHELGHALTLVHPVDPATGNEGDGMRDAYMYRGFDYMNRLFFVRDGNIAYDNEQIFIDEPNLAKLIERLK